MLNDNKSTDYILKEFDTKDKINISNKIILGLNKKRIINIILGIILICFIIYNIIVFLIKPILLLFFISLESFLVLILLNLRIRKLEIENSIIYLSSILKRKKKNGTLS